MSVNDLDKFLPGTTWYVTGTQEIWLILGFRPSESHLSDFRAALIWYRHWSGPESDSWVCLGIRMRTITSLEILYAKLVDALTWQKQVAGTLTS